MIVTGEGYALYTIDCLEWLKAQPDDSIDMIFCSPPYEQRRSYGGLKKLAGVAWVDWAAERYLECVRVCSGMVAWVVEGQTNRFQYSCTPQMLMAKLHYEGVKFRKPPAYFRHGVMGSGGPDWFRNDYEFVLCSTKSRLPWSNNVAMGHPPKYAPGGPCSNRGADDKRVRRKAYKPPALANPGNVIHCKVGKGHMGHDLSHKNEAPFPVSLPYFFVKSCLRPGGTLVDIFSGSGSSGQAVLEAGEDRKYIGIDCREDQTELAGNRLAEVANAVHAASSR